MDFLVFFWGWFQWVLVVSGVLSTAGGCIWLYRVMIKYSHMIEPISREFTLFIGWIVYLVALGYSIGHWLKPVVAWFG